MSFAATILIPLKSQQDAWLEQCVRSAVEQTAACETIVIRALDTPASNVGLLDRLSREFANLRVLIEDKPGSFPGALNLGIREAGSDRIGFLLSDDWLEADAVAACAGFDSDIVSTGATVYYADGLTLQDAATGEFTAAKYESLATLEAKARFLEHFFLFRKAALIAAGGLDESIGNYPGIDDYDLIWTLLECGASVSIVERRLYNYRDHQGERLTLADRARAEANLIKILRKHGIAESEIRTMVASQSRWFGRPLYEAIADSRR